MYAPSVLLLEASLVELSLRQLTEEISLLQLQASIAVLSSQREMELGQLHQLSENTKEKLADVSWHQ